MGEHHQLKRSLGFWALFIYGVGDILGAGIYALVGKIAGIALDWSWLAFMIAIGVASLTALSYAEMVSRFPHSGGAAYFCQQAFRRPEPVLIIGWLVFCSGLFSMATLSHAFADYFGAMLPLKADPEATSVVPILVRASLIVIFLSIVCYVNFRGIELSSTANIICTSIEVTGLLIIIGAGLLFLAGGGEAVANASIELPEATPSVGWLLVLQAGALAFYACIGFEDLVNVAEETIRPERNLPLALLAALATAGLLYLATVLICIHVVPPAELGQVEAPLLYVLERAAPNFPSGLFAAIPLFAVANSALLNGIMASRLLYGMSREGLVPGFFAHVHLTRRTPHFAIIAVWLAAVALALSGTLVFLAGSASVLLLSVFLLVHIALLVVKLRVGGDAPFRIHPRVPLLGILLTGALIVFIPLGSLLPAALMLGLGLLIAIVHWALMGRS